MSPNTKRPTLNTYILILGGTGFVGEAIVDELLFQNYRPVVLTHSKSIPRKWEGRVEVVEGDAANPESYSAQLRQFGISAVIYAIGIIRETKRVSYQQAHFEWAESAFKVAKELEIKKFIYLSAEGIEHNETGYQKTKLRFEKFLQHQDDLEFSIVRPGLVTGVSEKYNFVQVLKTLTAFRIVPLIGSGNMMLNIAPRQLVAKVVVQQVYTETHEIVKIIKSETAYKKLLLTISRLFGSKIMTIPLPVSFFKFLTRTLGRFSFFPLTEDQLTMLLQKYHG